MKNPVVRALRLTFVIGFVLLLSLETAPAVAIEDADLAEYPTLAAIQDTHIPPADRIDLARRIHGIEVDTKPPRIVRIPDIGDVETFWVNNSDSNTFTAHTAELLAMGEHIYVWVESGHSVNPASAEAFAEAFDSEIYLQSHALFGEEPQPGIDGDPRIHALFTTGISSQILAYFTSHHTFPEAIRSNSNERDMLIFNLNAVGRNLNSPQVLGTAAHEFQHMIQQNMDGNESSWVDEGLAVFSTVALGFERFPSAAIAYLQAPETQLNAWGANEPIVPHYGASGLFMTYFYDRYGADGVRAISQNPLNELSAFDEFLRSQGDTDFDTFFADWVLANVLNDPEAGFGYDLLEYLPSVVLEASVSAYPFEQDGETSQYSAQYFELNDLREAAQITVDLQMQSTVSLVDLPEADGSFFWYSNKADDSDMTLTRLFDLRDVDSATLAYNVWYDIEEYWDYGYLMASVDGKHWDVLETSNMSQSDPNFKAYGSGYTGVSNGWEREQVSLEAYAGQEVMIRFEMITDDATTQAGMVIDNIEIPQIGYREDFEQSDGNWESAGWLFTDNRLPQKFWLQIVQFAGDEITLSRWMLNDNQQVTIELEDDTDRAMLVLSPIAPLTTVKAEYNLRIAAE